MASTAEGWAICTLSGQLVDSDAGYRELVGFSGDDAAGFDFVAAGIITKQQLAELGARLQAGGGFSEPAYPYCQLDGTVELADVRIEPIDLSGVPAYAAQIRPLRIQPRRQTVRDLVRRECFRALRAALPQSRV